MSVITKFNFSRTSKDKIHTTTDYEGLLALRHSSNRVISKAHVNKLALNIIDNKQINPVILSAEGVLIDGQHRILACQELEIPVTFMLLTNLPESEEAQTAVNAVMKPWSENDYIHAGVEKGIAGYSYLQDLMEFNKVTCSMLNDCRVLPNALPKVRKLQPIVFTLSAAEMESILAERTLLAAAYKRIFGKQTTASFNRAFGYINTILKDKIPGFSWVYIANHLENTRSDPAYTSSVPRICISEMDFIHYFGSAFNFNKAVKNRNHLFFQGKIKK